MYKSIKILSAAGVFAAVLGASAFAQTEWKPPAEIAPKAATEAGAAAPADAAAATPADKQKSGDEHAKPKEPKGKAKKHHKS